MASVNPSAFGPLPQFVDTTGSPDSGYKLFVYVGGSTNTKQNSYTTAVGDTPNTNPILLNTLGQTPSGFFWTAGATYKIVLAPSTDTDPPTNPIWTIDGLRGINDTTVSQSQWVVGPQPTFISATSFSLVGDQTSIFQAGDRLQLVDGVGTKYAAILTSTYDGVSLTTVTTINDSGLSFVSPISSVAYGLLTSTNISIPRFIQAGANITITYDASGRPVITGQTITVPVLQNYLTGMTLSTAGSSAIMGIAAGQATDSTNAAYISIATAFTKTTATWAVGTGNGGLDTGTIANSTWYHFYAIDTAAGGASDITFSVNATTPILSGAYVGGKFRRVGSALTNGSAQWTLFQQFGDWFRFSVPVTIANGVAYTATYIPLSTSTPLGIRTRAFGKIQPGGSGSVIQLRPVGAADGAASALSNPLGYGTSTGNGDMAWTEFTDTNAQIQISGNSTVNSSLTTEGWFDNRGKI